VALHINHGLQSASDDWADHCQRTCQSLGIELTVLKANVDLSGGKGIEGAAREARYNLFESFLQKNDLLLLAQHSDDQLETVLLQLLRGAGPAGLAAMPRIRPLGDGQIARPFLSLHRTTLEQLAKRYQLQWVEDPSNENVRFERNFLRHSVIPQLLARYPACRETVARSASHCADANDTVQAIALDDFALCNEKNEPNVLSVMQLKSLSEARIRAVIRFWIARAGLKSPQAVHLQNVLSALLGATSDPLASVSLLGFDIRLYQKKLYLVRHNQPQIKPFFYAWNDLSQPLTVAELGLDISLSSLNAMGIDVSGVRQLTVRSRQGGETIRQGAPVFHKTIKKIFQESSIAPWLRDRYYLLESDSRIIAVPGLVVDPEFRIYK
jgi:tRNA(Ile)-lysidine synthase